MKIKYGIQKNCSEWDEEVGDYDEPIIPLSRRKAIEKEITASIEKAKDWDDSRNRE